MQKWRAKLKISSGHVDVYVTAANFFAAKQMLESMYGKGNGWGGPTPC